MTTQQRVLDTVLQGQAPTGPVAEETYEEPNTSWPGEGLPSFDELIEMDGNDALMSLVGEEWTPQEYQMYEELQPDQKMQVLQNVMKYDFMEDPFVGVVDDGAGPPTGDVEGEALINNIPRDGTKDATINKMLQGMGVR